MAPSIWEQVKQWAVGQAEPAMASFVQVDIEGQRLFLGHTALTAGLRWALTDVEGVEVRDLVGGAGGYRIRALVNGRDVGALLVPQQVQWSGGKVFVRVHTPEGVQSYDRSFAMACVVAYATLFGGTPLVTVVLDRLAPAGWTWDGELATWTCDLVGQLDAPPFMRTATGAELSSKLDDNGAWLTLEGVRAEVSLPDLAVFLGGLAIKRGLGA